MVKHRTCSEPASNMTAATRITPLLKWQGGKTYMADRIIDVMSEHLHYLEPFCGGSAVLLRKNPEGVSEALNDRNGDLTNPSYAISPFRKIFSATLHTLAAGNFAVVSLILLRWPCSEDLPSCIPDPKYAKVSPVRMTDREMHACFYDDANAARPARPTPTGPWSNPIALPRALGNASSPTSAS